jgi:hypothetical protein
MRAIIVTASIIVLTATALDRADADPAADQAIQEKIAPIIDCINNSDFRLQRTFQAYRRTLDDIKRTGSASFVGGFEDMDTRFANSLKCADGLDQAVKAAPKIEDIDHAASEYATAIREFAPIGVEADRYYSQNDYKDDKWAKGQEIDGKLQPLIAKLEAASEGLHTGVHRELKGIRERRLAALEAKSGKNLRWHAENFMIIARGVLEDFAANPAPGVIAPAVERAQKAYDDAEAYAGTHDSELHPSPILIPSAWASMENDAGFFLRDLKELRRALESAKPSPTQLQRDYQSLVRSFNNLVNGYNNSRS